MTKLKSESDILSDDCGVWINNGQHKFLYAQICDDWHRYGKNSKITKPEILEMSELTMTLHRHYYLNKDAKDFHRTVSFTTGIIYFFTLFNNFLISVHL